jgi:hypothetical protein
LLLDSVSITYEIPFLNILEYFNKILEKFKMVLKKLGKDIRDETYCQKFIDIVPLKQNFEVNFPFLDFI